MNISNEIREKLISQGASIVGFADLSIIPEQNRREFKYGIIIGVALNPMIVSLIKNEPIQEYYDECERVDELLNILNEYVSEILKGYGYEALAKTQSVVKIDNNKRTELPHKTIATRAGIGWIGKGALLVTEEFGSAIRISSALTNAELEVGNPIDICKCGSCTECKNSCPGNVIDGKSWKVKLDRDEFFNAVECKNIIVKKGKMRGQDRFTCGICIASCPWTQQYINKWIKNKSK